MFITREFTFSAAHNLTNYHGKCEELHGHTFKLSITLEGSPIEEDGMIVNFITIKDIVQENILNLLDHKYLNNIFKNPTCENIVSWIFNKLDPVLKGENYSLYEVRLWESSESSVTLRRETE